MCFDKLYKGPCWTGFLLIATFWIQFNFHYIRWWTSCFCFCNSWLAVFQCIIISLPCAISFLNICEFTVTFPSFQQTFISPYSPHSYFFNSSILGDSILGLFTVFAVHFSWQVNHKVYSLSAFRFFHSVIGEDSVILE